MYSKITNPETGRQVSIYGKIGQMVLRKYLTIIQKTVGGGFGSNDKWNGRVHERPFVTVVLLRHGKSEGNKRGSNVPDPDLTALGRRQAAAWAPVTARWAAKAEERAAKAEEESRPLPRMSVLVSPLQRAQQTAAHAFSDLSLATESLQGSGGEGGEGGDDTAVTATTTSSSSRAGAVSFAVALEARELWWNSADPRG